MTPLPPATPTPLTEDAYRRLLDGEYIAMEDRRAAVARLRYLETQHEALREKALDLANDVVSDDCHCEDYVVGVKCARCRSYELIYFLSPAQAAKDGQ